MPFDITAKRIGLKKEGTRLTAETTPTEWIAVLPETEFQYDTALLEDQSLRGTPVLYPPVGGQKVVSGKIVMPVRPQNIGEIFHMLMGDASSAQQGGTAAYKHTFSIPTATQLDTYTIFVDRGINVQKYSGCVVKSVTIESPVDGPMKLTAEVVGLVEASGSIGSPAYTESAMLAFYHNTIKNATVTETNIKAWSVKLDNGAFAKFVQNASQSAADVLRAGMFRVTGTMLAIFEDGNDRTDFLAPTARALQFLSEGAVIASTYKYTLDINLYAANWRAYPWGEDQNLVAAQAEFEGFYSTSDSKLAQVDVTNIKTAYT